MSKTIIAAAMAFVLCFCAAHTHSAAVAVIEEINSQCSHLGQSKRHYYRI